MIYPWLKALHVASALVFAGGVLAVSVLLLAVKAEAAIMTSAARAVWRWDKAVTMPAMILVWGLGLTLATLGAWFGRPWLSAKLVFVVALSGIHGVQSGQLRRLASGKPATFRRLTPFVILSVLTIAVLAVVKPG